MVSRVIQEESSHFNIYMEKVNEEENNNVLPPQENRMPQSTQISNERLNSDCALTSGVGDGMFINFNFWQVLNQELIFPSRICIPFKPDPHLYEAFIVNG